MCEKAGWSSDRNSAGFVAFHGEHGSRSRGTVVRETFFTSTGRRPTASPFIVFLPRQFDVVCFARLSSLPPTRIAHPDRHVYFPAPEALADTDERLLNIRGPPKFYASKVDAISPSPTHVRPEAVDGIPPPVDPRRGSQQSVFVGSGAGGRGSEKALGWLALSSYFKGSTKEREWESGCAWRHRAQPRFQPPFETDQALGAAFPSNDGTAGPFFGLFPPCRRRLCQSSTDSQSSQPLVLNSLVHNPLLPCCQPPALLRDLFDIRFLLASRGRILSLSLIPSVSASVHYWAVQTVFPSL